MSRRLATPSELHTLAPAQVFAAAKMEGGKPLKEQNKEFFIKLLSSQAHPHPHLLGYTYIAIVDLHCPGMTAACRRR